MCPSKSCPARRVCYRNAASGTEPSPRQSYMGFGSELQPGDEACKHFAPTDAAWTAGVRLRIVLDLNGFEPDPPPGYVAPQPT